MEVGEIVEETEVDLDKVQERQAPKKAYQLPSADILANPVNIQDGLSRDELVERANFLQQSLETFGVKSVLSTTKKKIKNIKVIYILKQNPLKKHQLSL